MSLIQAQALKKHYRLGKTVVEALRGLDLSIEEGEFTAIAGPSGSGKTTLLNLLGCIEIPSEGIILFDGVDIGRLTPSQKADFRAENIGFVFQTFNLIPVLTAFENVEFPLFKKNLSRTERRRRVEEAVEVVGLAQLGRHRPDELSGGQRQRVAIARALVGRPGVILADEPTANLDHQTGSQVLEIMQEINQRYRTVFLFSTHDTTVMNMARRLIHMSDGRLASEEKQP
ncbi:MAG: ABC transporter ATP-binding protein [Thermodesulfobacteriota bacterium]|nr:ABC transporter ATP-binding protein [Thermodesulfobacteriota bacterium]